MSDHVSPEFIEQFNTAAALSRAGKHKKALAGWRRMLDKRQKKAGLMMSGRFLGVSTMRKAWVLMDLGRIKEARSVFESDIMRACLSQLNMSDLYAYFFSYGNTLGQLRDIKGMDDAMTRALGIASEELGDLGRCRQTWLNLISHAASAGAWGYLERECRTALTFARNTESHTLELRAWQTLVQALDALGRGAEARSEARGLQSRASALSQSLYDRWARDFLGIRP